MRERVQRFLKLLLAARDLLDYLIIEMEDAEPPEDL